MLGVSYSALLFTSWVIFVASVARAQNQTQPTTDPSEVSALNSVFAQWNIKADTEHWNTTGDPCTGAAINDAISIGEGDYNPFIKCQCTFNSSTVCRITELKVYAIDVSGPIPEELWTLRFLVNLNLGQNYLSGSLSPSVGNLTRMQYMGFGINALSGPLPKELGQLADLRMLSISGNNFSGPLPSELGNLLKLDQLYMDSSGISGDIPSTFANLQNMQRISAMDNELTGTLDVIGNWSQLLVLRLQGNSFEGPIPSSFSSLTNLTELFLGEISNVNSSLDFIRNMKSLSTLILRNNNFTGSIPSNIGEFEHLMHLDLSFNKLSGSIPTSLFNLSSLANLFLGNNSFNGTIPEQKRSSLLTIDLSYNNLVGSIPSWVNSTTNLQINLVGNNFTLESSENSARLSGLNCLQKNFPCGLGSPLYSEFGINSGGPAISASDGSVVYEEDTEKLSAASYYVTPSKRWGVSNVGTFIGNNNISFIGTSSSQFTSTLNTELFQTTRLSASSLRYYGLGLENGNYTVKLEFSELAFPSGRTWKSTGRRVFDVYIQGKIVLKDFDITKEAGGVLSRAVARTFTALVSENNLEVHFFWAGKGTCCIPLQGTYGPSISAVSATPNFTPTVNNKPPSTNENKTGLIVGVVVGVSILVLVCMVVAFFIVRRRRKYQMFDDEEFLGMDVRPLTFSYTELKTATHDFDSANKLGEGGFGPVFKGTLEDGRVIAVKQLSLTSHQGKSQFVTEIATISAVQHRNLVKLYGCCIEGDKRLLVYEFLENNSLDQAMFGKERLKLDWQTRFEICLGVARGLTYLHEESRLRIVHRDVKSSNILLDSNLVPKISDFGLAKLYDDKKTHISTRVAGTIGYLAPEYAMRGHLTEKTDVFAFGVVALEIVSGRANSDSTLDEEKMYLLEWAWNLHEQDRALELVDPELSKFDEEEVKRIISVALLCTQTSPGLRPAMSRVVAMLSGDAEVSTEISRPGYLSDWKYSDVSSLVTDTATKGTNSSFFDSSASTSIVSNNTITPGNSTVSEGR